MSTMMNNGGARGRRGRGGVSHDICRFSRKAQEAALRRYQAVQWLECVVGPLGGCVPTEPTEREFISCLRNGIVLCNAINKIQPGTIPKVVENHVALESESKPWDSGPLPAYQYFENVRNFLVAVGELKLPAFEASDLQRENFEAGSAARVADCILALKSYHEWKQNGGNGVYKHVTVKSPLVMHSAAENTEPVQPCRQLESPPVGNKQSLTESIAKALSQDMIRSKENLNANFLTSLQKGNQDPVQIFNEILAGCLEEKLRNKISPLKLQETSEKVNASHPQPVPILQENLSFKNNSECSQSRKSRSDHWRILNRQKKDVADIRALWTETKSEFGDLHNQLMEDLNSLGSLVEDMTEHARGYQKVLQENRKLYNTVQDLKGNVRVYCRIRPMLNSEARNVINFRGEDGTLVITDPTKLQGEGRKEYQFTRVYDPMATQDQLFKDAQPLTRSVMDGYNVCIFAYGQTRSGKSYTMYGPSGDSEKEMGLTFFALNDLFETANMRKYTISYELNIQMVEICNEQVRDLLSEVSTQQDESSLSKFSSHAVTTNTEAIDLVKQGKVRSGGSDSSNRSHSVVTVHVQGKDLSGKILRSHLHLVDLAGSGDDDRSLSFLEDVIASLTQKKAYSRYKDSKLTSLLQDTLGGKAKILVFAHVIQEEDGLTKTVGTLKFAQRISTIELGAAQANKTNSEVMELKNELECLKSALGETTACSTEPTKQPKSPREKARVMLQKSPVKLRRLSLENQSKSAIGDRRACSPESTKQPKSPQEKARVPQKSPLKSRRLSIENQSKSGVGDKRACSPQSVKQPKSPREIAARVIPEKSPVRSRRLSLENRSKSTVGGDPSSSIKQPKSPREKAAAARVMPSKSPVRSRRLSLENQSKSTAGDKRPRSPQSTKQPKSPREKTRVPQKSPLKSRVLSIESEEKGSIIPQQTPLRVRRLSLEQPIAKNGNVKGSQIKKSLRAIGKLINGSEKRTQQKEESTSVKSRDGSRKGAKSPQSPKARVSRRHSLTSLPPTGTVRRTSLGGMSTDSAKRWM